mgnify:CR=1 FL=1
MSLNPYLIDIMFRVPNEVMDRVEDNYEYIEDLVQDKFNCRIRLETTSLRNDRTTMVSVSSKKPLPEGCFVFVQNMVLQKRRSRREERRPRREERRPRREERKPRRKEKREDSRIVKEIAIKESSIPIAIGSKRSNIKRIIELVGERGTYIRIPRREENSNKFTIFANTEEAMEKIIEEFRQFMENDEKEPKYMPTEKEVKEVKEEEVEEEDLTMKSGGWDDQ